jgi:hypothetical protein
MNQLPNHIRAWKKPAKKSERSKLIEKLDSIFSDFIRLRDSNEFGHVTCITCYKDSFWRDSDNGHYQDRDHMATRFDEENCNAQCLECNRYEPVNKGYFAAMIDERHGHGTAAKLDKAAKSTQQWEDHDLKKMIEYYRCKVEELKNQKGMI